MIRQLSYSKLLHRMLKGQSCCFSLMCQSLFCSVLWPPNYGLPAEGNWMMHDECCAFGRWTLQSILFGFHLHVSYISVFAEE